MATFLRFSKNLVAVPRRLKHYSHVDAHRAGLSAISPTKLTVADNSIKVATQTTDAEVTTVGLPSANVHLNTGNFLNTNRKLGAIFTPNVLRSITTTGWNRSVTETQPKDEHPDGETIYTGEITRGIKCVHLFSLTTSAMGLLAQTFLWQKGLEVSGTGLSVLICSVHGVLIFFTPILSHLVTKKYVIDIKYNKKTDEYTCTTVSFFLFQNKIKFKVEDVIVVGIEGTVNIKLNETISIEPMFSTMLIGPKKQPVCIDAASFTDTHHFARFMETIGMNNQLNHWNANANEQSTKSTSNGIDDASHKQKSI